MRTIRFVSSLYTTDNLTLVKRFLNVGLRFGGWLYDIVPNTTEEGLSRFWASIFPAGQKEDVDDNDFVYDPIEPSNFETADVRSIDDDNFVNSFANQAMDLHSLINTRRK